MRALPPTVVCLLSALIALPALAGSPPAYLGSWGTMGSGAGQFQYPSFVAVDASGHVYVGDPGRVQIFTPNGGFVSQWPLSSASEAVHGIAIDGLGRVHLLGSYDFTDTQYEIRTADGSLI